MRKGYGEGLDVLEVVGYCWERGRGVSDRGAAEDGGFGDGGRGRDVWEGWQGREGLDSVLRGRWAMH